MNFITIYHFYQKVENWESRKALHNKTEYLIHIRNLQQALNHGLVLKKVYRVIKLCQNAWLKPYIYQHEHRSRKKTKNDFIKDFFNLMNNTVFGKVWKMWENRDIKLVTTERRRDYLVSEPKTKLSYYKVFHRISISNRNEKNADTYE